MSIFAYVLVWLVFLSIVFFVCLALWKVLRRVRWSDRFEITFSDWDGGRFEKVKYWSEIKYYIRKWGPDYLFIDVEDLRTGKRKRFKDNPDNVPHPPVFVQTHPDTSGQSPSEPTEQTCVSPGTFHTGDYSLDHYREKNEK